MTTDYPVAYLYQERVRYEDRVRDWMNDNLVCDIPTHRYICRQYYALDPYLDVTFLGAEPYLLDNILARFVHDPMKTPHPDYEPVNWGDEIVIRQDEGFVARRIPLSPRILLALRRVIEEP